MPVISVIMAVFNAEDYVAEATESILNQTFTDFEFIIIDDGSTDNTLHIIKDYADQDDRIRVVINENNVGLAKSLNKGIALAKGKYIARMDADDISLLDRFEKQVDFLERNPEIGALGGSTVHIDQNGNFIRQNQYLERPNQIRWATFFGNNAAHPTVMMRASLFKEAGIQYDENLTTTQDFDLWVKILKHSQFANLPDVLVKFRRHGGSVSSKFNDVQKQNNLRVRRDLIKETVKIHFSNAVIEGTKKPFDKTNILNSCLSILLILLLKNEFRLYSIAEADQAFIKQDVAYRISNIIQNSGKRWLFFPFLIYVLVLRDELKSVMTRKLRLMLKIKKKG